MDVACSILGLLVDSQPNSGDGVRVGGHLIHSLNEPGELLQCLYRDDNTVHSGISIIVNIII